MMIRKSRFYLLTLTVFALALPGSTSVPAAQNVPGPFQLSTAPLDSSPAAKAPPPAACTGSVGTPLKDCQKDGEGNIVIGSGATKCTGNVLVDEKSIKLGKITINSGGALILDDATAAQLKPTIETTGIDINGGSMLIGNPDCPIGTTDPKSELKIMFIGPKPTTCGTPNNIEASQCPGWEKGIQVESGGTLRMYGLKGVVSKGGVSWTYLAKPGGTKKYNNKGKNDVGNLFAPLTDPTNVIHLAADVTAGPAAWRPDDWIVIATTSFSPWESEFVQIDHVEKEGSGSRVKLKQHLHYYHFGGPDPGIPGDANYQAGATLNFGVDERAEVGLISRNIVLTSDSDTNYQNNKKESKHWGGEIRIIDGFTAVSIQGVELQKFGKEQIGSYPIHFHRAGDLESYADANKLVDSNSIDHSYNKCVTVHSTQNATLSNNVCARITGHIFYEEVGDESNIAFNKNLGIGAMSNSFDVHATAEKSRDALMDNFYWPGDHLVKSAPFDQINIFDTDNQFVADIKNNLPRVRGSCGSFGSAGRISLDRPFNDTHTTCDPAKGDVYFEPPTGFWITNPSAKLTGNSIAGCQDVGKAYWYVPPRDSSSTAVKFIPIGPNYTAYGASKYGLFQNNRGHACYSGVYGEDDGIVTSDQLFPYANAIHDSSHQPVVDEFDGLTLSRIRDRGVWLRPTFFVVKSARIATSRDGVSLVTSGGVDGNYPGVWGLLQDSTMVGVSQNNEDRWGPCGAKVLVGGAQVRGGSWGCIDVTVPKVGTSATGGEFLDRGYPDPDWPMYGFMIYDGPPLIIHDRFVNFRVAPGSKAPTGFTAANLLTHADDCILNGCPDDEPPVTGWIFSGISGCPNPPPAYTTYEGDAALGWFNVNPSSYPAATTTKQLSFTNVDLRHQIYTEQVNRGGFTDGDENTTIVDLDGTLSGVAAKDANGEILPSISLNNLGINASSNSADECLAQGGEDALLEGRPTSAMVPSALGQLEFEMLYPPSPQPASNPVNFLAHRELLTFTKNNTDFNSLTGVEHHQSMPLTSRNGLGDWEPKVTNGYGYTVTAGTYQLSSLSCSNVPPTANPGISGTVDLTMTDIVNAHNIDAAHPFYVQLGICYTRADGSHPKFADVVGDLFTIKKGYRSYGSGNVIANDTLKPYWGGLLDCNSLDNQLAIRNGDSPTDTKTMPTQCPSKSSTGSPIVDLTKVNSYSQLTSDGTKNGPPNLGNYFYDETNGWLFLWVAQTEPNAQGPSPLGNCTGDPSTDPSFCPSKTTGDSYYVCPAQGCPSYRIVLNAAYQPGASTCGDPYSEGYEWPGGPLNENTLVLAGTTTTAVVQQQQQGPSVNGAFPFPHYAPTPALNCPLTTP
jgi:G8 domain